MNLQHLRAMVLVAEHGSISSAAKELYITPVSLLQQINLLEGEIGFKIFNRSTRGVTLTSAGTKFYVSAKRSLKQLDILLEECRELAGKQKKILTVGIYIPYDFIRFCSAYQSKHPQISFQFKPSIYEQGADFHALLSRGEFDVLQETYAPEHIPASVCTFPILRDRLCCYCTPTHPLAKYQTISLSNMVPYHLFFPFDFTQEYKPLRAEISRLGGHAEGFAYTDFEMLRHCNNGDLCLMDESSSRYLSNLKCIPIEPAFPVFHSIIYSSTASNEVQSFIQFIRQYIGECNIAQMEKEYQEMMLAAH